MGNKIEMTVTERYDVVEAKSINDLVRLVNLKTKAGWNVVGGIVYSPTNFCNGSGEIYPFCQTVIKVEYKKKR